ncbi:hypothetical protein [Streptomyces sp. ADI93-02]|uniref:hypothetical protein n=1 Tax=Streptomyces sp. ADI93-02 TaxID=1522757 RepID=UPI000F5510AE|nr:hypothetical protein [Streptomyces sp. ADI93-02]
MQIVEATVKTLGHWPDGSALAMTNPLKARVVTRSATSPASAVHSVPVGEHTVTRVTGDVVTNRQVSPGARGTVTVRDVAGRPAQSRPAEAGNDL